MNEQDILNFKQSISNLSIEEYEQELKKMIQISKETKNLEDDLNKFVQKNYVKNK